MCRSLFRSGSILVAISALESPTGGGAYWRGYIEISHQYQSDSSENQYGGHADYGPRLQFLTEGSITEIEGVRRAGLSQAVFHPSSSGGHALLLSAFDLLCALRRLRACAALWL